MAIERIAIVTNVIPAYRRAFYEHLVQDPDIEVRIYCQSEVKGQNLTVCHDVFSPHIELVNAWSLDREKLAWQRLPIRRLFQNHDIYIFYGNPRLFSNVLWSLLLRLFGRKVGLWGQAHTAGSNAWSEALRLLWWRAFSNLFVYTDDDVSYLTERGLKSRNIIGMNNGLDQRFINNAKEKWSIDMLDAWKESQGISSRRVILSCARLESKNAFHLVPPALQLVKEKFPDVIWCVIGDGCERDRLQNLVVKHAVTKNVKWLGAIYDEDELAPWFISAKCMIHPSGIGLSLLHAFGYGLPVITHDNRVNHMPEIAALKDGENGLLYRENNIESMAHGIIKMLSDDEHRKAMCAKAFETAQTRFNTEVMHRRFKSFVAAM